MLGIRVPFGAGDENRSTMLWMEWVSDDHLDRQIPGSMTLFRPAAENRIWRRRSAWR
jgi:hypothetical protein